MMSDIGVEWAIVAHSERREHHDEDDEVLTRKIQKSFEAGLKVVYCVGDSKQEKDEGRA